MINNKKHYKIFNKKDTPEIESEFLEKTQN